MLSSSSRRRWSASRRARVETGQVARAPSRAPAIRSASGIPPHARSRSAVASGSAASRAAPASCGQQDHRLVVGQRGQAELVRAGQLGEPVAAGDQHRAAVGRGQQRTHLLGVPGVVQHDQDPGAAQQAAIAGGALLEPGRHLGGVLAEGAQPLAEHGLRGQRVLVGAEQVHVQLPVREALGDPVRDVHGQRGLAEPAAAGDRGDGDLPRVAGAGQQRGAQVLDLRAAAGEVGGAGRELGEQRRPRRRLVRLLRFARRLAVRRERLLRARRRPPPCPRTRAPPSADSGASSSACLSSVVSVTRSAPKRVATAVNAAPVISRLPLSQRSQEARL